MSQLKIGTRRQPATAADMWQKCCIGADRLSDADGIRLSCRYGEEVGAVALKRLRFIQRRKALSYTQEELAGQLGCERTTIIRWERAETEPQPWLRPKIARLLQLTAEELGDLLADVADVPDGRDGFTLVSSIPLDFSLSAAYTIRVIEGFSAHDIVSRRDALADLTVIAGAALLRPVRQWAASLAPLTGSSHGIGADEVTELERAVTLFRRWDASGAGGLRRKAVVGQLNSVAESLSENHPPEITRRLFQISAELAQLAGFSSALAVFGGTRVAVGLRCWEADPFHMVRNKRQRGAGSRAAQAAGPLARR